jgi:cyclopropane-fatty-acyl-phospholipid synthase
MQLARFLNSVFTKGGFILTDASNNKYIIGDPNNNPIKVKILNPNLNYKLLFHPDLYFGEAYTNGEIIIENGTLTDFLDLALMNFGRGDLNFFSYLINMLRGSYRYLTNFNFIKKSKMNVSHHYDISDELYDLFLDPKRQYSCAYFKKRNDSLEVAQIIKYNTY